MQTPLLALLARVAQSRGGATVAATLPTSSSASFFARATLATSCSPPRAPAESSASTASEGDAAPTPLTASAAEARSALRALLRSVDAHFTSVAANAQWRDFVLEQARRSAAAAKEKDASSLVTSARDYVTLIENVAKHRALLREYNLGLDPDERNRQMVEKTAARVGFSIPKGKEEEEGSEDDTEEGGKKSIARRAAAARAAAAAAAGGGGTGGGATARKGRRG